MKRILKQLWWTISYHAAEVALVTLFTALILFCIWAVPKAIEEHNRREASLERLERIESHLCATSPNKVFLKCE